MFSIFDFLNIYGALVAAILLAWFYTRSKHKYWSKLNVKYVEPMPFLGNTAPMLFRFLSFHEQYDQFYKALGSEPCGGVYEIHQPQLIVKDPELVNTILVKDFKHFYDRGMEQQFNRDKSIEPLTAHLFFAEGDRWRALRQQMSPVFTSGKLKLMHEQILACVDLLDRYVDVRLDANDSVDLGMKELFNKLTIDVIGSCAFGIDCNSLKSNEEFSRVARETTKSRPIVTVRSVLGTFSERLAKWTRIGNMSKEVGDFFINLIFDTMDYRRRNGVSRNDFLQMLMELQNTYVDSKFAVGDKERKVLETEEFDEMDIAANAFVVFVAGFETTASTLSYCLYELALNQDIQDKLRSEVQQIKDTSGDETMNYEILRGITYMDAVIKETLRKYPAVTYLTRKCTKDYLIPGTKTHIPVGTEVVIPVWSLHHDWKYFPNPEVFDPQRFLGDNKHSRPSGVYMPFGDGPRYCLGKRFADMEMRAALADMVLRYDIKPCAKTEIPLKYIKGPGMVLPTTCGTWVNLTKRKN